MNKDAENDKRFYQATFFFMFTPTDKKEKYLNYKSPLQELSGRELKFASWYVRHKILITRITTFSLFVFGFFTNLFGIVMWGKYVLFDYSNDQALLRSLVTNSINYTATKERLGARPLAVGTTQLYDSAPGKYDVVTTVSNPNPFHYAVVTFRHSAGVPSDKTTTMVVLPQKTVPLTSFGVESLTSAPSANFVIDSIQWKRLNRHTIPDPKAYIDQRLQFEISNVAFQRKNTIDGVATNKLTFDLSNLNPYSYWSPLFIVSLIDGGTTGVLRLEVPELRAGETRFIDLRSLSDFASASEIEVTPVINVFDKNEYILPGN